MKRRVPRVVAWIFALSCIAGSLFTSWVSFTVRPSTPGWRFGILRWPDSAVANLLPSFGAAAALLCLIGLWAFLNYRHRLLSYTATILLLLVIVAFLQLAFVDGALLRDLVSDQNQYRNVEMFTHKQLPTNLGGEATRQIEIDTSTLWGQALVAQYFLGLGWYIVTIAGVTGLVTGLRAVPAVGDRRAIVLFGVIAFLCTAALHLARPVLAQHALSRGITRQCEGDLDNALKEYRKAIRLDSWKRVHSAVYGRIGAIDAMFGRTNTVECGVYKVETYVLAQDLPSATATIETLLPKAGALTPTLRKWHGDLCTLLGMDLYRKDAVGDATLLWESALKDDADQWLARFCLSRAYYDLGRYQDSLNLITPMLAQCADPLLLADLYSNQGDSLMKLGKFGEAHLAYRNSYQYDSVLNWRALTALVGAN